MREVAENYATVIDIWGTFSKTSFERLTRKCKKISRSDELQIFPAKHLDNKG